ncbi:MAG TPA: DUF1566 domain-containing protein [Spirochaetes bacterium]|nr:DUF1566 domain-containing protein [Spirochaetota bacterium]
MRIILITVIAFLMAVGLYAAARFNNNGDGTVTDMGTGLVWQKCSYNQSVLDCSGLAGNRTWQQALEYCRNLSLAGRSWRLPSINELKSIVEYSLYNPAINTACFPNTQASEYWSSTSRFDIPASALLVKFNYGSVISDQKTKNYYVRCVADGP